MSLNPKFEYLNPKQILNPKSPNPKPVLFGKLDFKICDLFRISDFGFRICLIAFLFFLSGCQEKIFHKDTRAMMGTFVEVVSSDPRAPQTAFAEIARIEKLLSRYDPDSEVSRLNAAGELKVSPETFYVLKKAKWFCRESAGAFDPTCAVFSDLWGFSDQDYNIPEKSQVDAALRLVGCDKIILSEADNMVKLKSRGVKIDLGAIAKGYALDRAAAKLKEAGITSCLLNAGGQVYALGDKSGRPWKVAVRSARKSGFNGYLLLKDRAVATSGDYEQYFSGGESRYAHIFDPRTGYPADRGIISVTVSAPEGLSADALSTIVFIQGQEASRELLELSQAQIVACEDKSIDVKRFSD